MLPVPNASPAGRAAGPLSLGSPCVRLTPRIGWHGRAFVLPLETLGGSDAEPVRYGGDLPDSGGPAQRGDLPLWQALIGRHCPGQTRLLFAVSAALAAPCAALADAAAAAWWHLIGPSASGKPIPLRMAASVYGPPGCVQRWPATDNGLEALAAAHSDLPLILDEPAPLDDKKAAARLLLQGAGKARASRADDPCIRLTWRLWAMSAGEVGLCPDGARGAAAEPWRCVAELPADAGRGFGIFDGPGELGSAAALAAHLNAAALLAHGTLGRAWLSWLVEAESRRLSAELRERMAGFAGLALPAAAADDIRSTAERFALVAAAGEMATAAGLTGWPAGQAQAAALTLFRTWLDSRRATAGTTTNNTTTGGAR
jgi:putative DNA primase/helicase